MGARNSLCQAGKVMFSYVAELIHKLSEGAGADQNERGGY